MPSKFIDNAIATEILKSISDAAGGADIKIGVRNAKDDAPAEIAIYGEIGSPWDLADVRTIGSFLRDNKGRDVNVRINSGGGSAYDGIAIHNALKNHDGKITTIIEGMAGSAASVIAVAGSPVQIYDNAHFFIHRALMIAWGNRSAMQEADSWLAKVDDAIVKTYKAKTNKAYDKLMQMMVGNVDGTVMTATEAVEMKFCDVVLSLKDGMAKNQIDMQSVEMGEREKQKALAALDFFNSKTAAAQRQRRNSIAGI